MIAEKVFHYKQLQALPPLHAVILCTTSRGSELKPLCEEEEEWGLAWVQTDVVAVTTIKWPAIENCICHSLTSQPACGGCQRPPSCV